MYVQLCPYSQYPYYADTHAMQIHALQIYGSTCTSTNTTGENTDTLMWRLLNGHTPEGQDTKLIFLMIGSNSIYVRVAVHGDNDIASHWYTGIYA